ncbi:MAG: DNA polymerase domain-containing protein [Candidatus Thermoplasmatota archaeon]|nr:DNA polymerase domain-containing protein [Candidatus Thermoplasmatota archaeon]
MEPLLLGLSPEYLYFKQGLIEPISTYHHPYFLAFTGTDEPCASTRQRLFDLWQKNKENQTPFSYVSRFGELETYRSFWEYGKTFQAFKIYTTESYRVPEVSDHLFHNYGVYTGEHDIPYQQRALVDLLSSEATWPFDSAGKKQRLRMLVYDIELTKFELGKIDSPIDMIGYASSDILFESKKDLKNEIFQFDILDIPSTIDEKDIIQLVSRNSDEEIDNLSTFCKLVREYDIISGHNILGFDNRQIYGRILTILKQYQTQITPIEREIFETFLKRYCRVDKSFHFGISSDVVQIYPCSFDTYLASRKFYPFLDSHSLKAVAPFLGVGIPNRLILGPSEIKLDARTMKYNRQDILEQMGVTLHLIQQTLPLSFTTGMPFDMLLDSGAVNMWDHMSLIRGALQKKIIPATCRVSTIAQNLLRDFKECKTKKDIATKAKNNREQLSKEFIRVVKYGSEMPDWMLYPYVIYNEQAKDADERLNYHMPGGMTIKPDKDASSHFIPWYKVIVADVGAMYPTILKALNIGADTVRLCPKNETPDEWIWLKKIPTRFFEEHDVIWRKISKEDSYADKGFMIGVKIDTDPGVVNCAMTGIMSMIARIKQELKEVKTKGNTDELSRLKMMYQSVKGARNAGTHGIIAAPNVSGRQFNLWGAATITTKGQMILADTLEFLEKNGIRVVYGDTDGIYLGCSNSIKTIPHFSKALGVSFDTPSFIWLTPPEDAVAAIDACNNRWQKELSYPDFELEPEFHDAMIFVKHKNYLIFDEKQGSIEMITKGNNFKGSDKANIARKALKEIMIKVLKENPEWTEEDVAREDVKESIMRITQEIVATLDLSKVDIEDLTLIQQVKPASRYKRNQDGSMSTFGKRAAALEKVIGEPLRTTAKYRFVVTKQPLPGIQNPSKSGVKPIDYMYPIDKIEDGREIDLEWYKQMIENYIQGAFGLSQMQKTEQTGLDAWM